MFPGSVFAVSLVARLSGGLSGDTAMTMALRSAPFEGGALGRLAATDVSVR